jgi:hypothetical protein
LSTGLFTVAPDFSPRQNAGKINNDGLFARLRPRLFPDRRPRHFPAVDNFRNPKAQKTAFAGAFLLSCTKIFGVNAAQADKSRLNFCRGSGGGGGGLFGLGGGGFAFEVGGPAAALDDFIRLLAHSSLLCFGICVL